MPELRIISWPNFQSFVSVTYKKYCVYEQCIYVYTQLYILLNPTHVLYKKKYIIILIYIYMPSVGYYKMGNI